MTTEENRADDPVNKWVSQRLVRQIKDMEAVLDVLKNPYMRTPIQDMGLSDENLSDIRQNINDASCAYDLFTQDLAIKLSHSSQMQLHDLAEQNGIPSYFELMLMFRDAEYEFLTSSIGGLALHVNGYVPLDSAIKMAQSELDTANKERHAEFQQLHFVSIVLPQSAGMINTVDTIRETAHDILRKAFTNGVKHYASKQIRSDANALQGFPRLQKWLNGFGTVMASALGKRPDHYLAPSYPDSIKLEFAVRANVDDALRLGMLQPVFTKVAEDLSGTTLTSIICKHLPSNAEEQEIVSQPDSDDDQTDLSDLKTEPYDWIDIISPQSPR